MQEITIKYEIGLGLSNKGNQCIILTMIWPGKTKEIFGARAVEYICARKHMFTKEDISYVKELKKMTDKIFVEKK